jgi:AcrR family transcriptional regulator
MQKAVVRATPRAARTRLGVDERRAQLLALGLRIFSERAYDDVSIEELARAAGVSKGLLYHYFPTKRDFYVAAIEQASEQLLARTLTPRDLPPEERIRLGLDAYLDFVEEHGGAYVALMRSGIGSDPEVAAVVERSRSAFVDRIVEDVPKKLVTPLVRVALRGWIGFVEATATEWALHKGVARKRVVELMAGVLVGLVPFARGGAAA